MVNYRQLSALRRENTTMVFNRTLQGYLLQFTALNRNILRNYAAPHKPLLLMAICDLVADGTLQDNRIPLSDTLIDRFKQLWHQYVDTGSDLQHDSVMEELLVVERAYPFRCAIDKPYYHMKAEPFWHLQPTDKWQKHREYTVAQLRQCYQDALIDPELFNLMSAPASRMAIYQHLKDLL